MFGCTTSHMHVLRTSSRVATSSHWLKCSSNVANFYSVMASCWSSFSMAAPYLPRAERHSSARRRRLDSTLATHYAWQRVKEMPKLVDFEYHPAPSGQTPYGSRQARCMFRVKVPASMRSASHLVWMEATSTAMRGLRPRVSSFIRARCTCAIGSSATCVHLAMLIMIVHNLPRPDVNGSRAEGIPVTSQLCAWNRPGGGEIYDVTKPLSRLPFLRESHMDMLAGDDNARRRVVMCSSCKVWVALPSSRRCQNLGTQF